MKVSTLYNIYKQISLFKNMKGVILAGGKGTRLWPLTVVTNKHLVPVGNLPMIEYPLFTIKNLGVDSISVVTGGEHFKDIAGYLGELHHEIDFSYHYQPKAIGIAQALSLTEKFVNNGKLAVILGDNIFEDDFYEESKKFEKEDFSATLFLKEVNDPERFGVAEIKGNKIISIEEKPKSNLSVTGLYFYDSTVFDRIKKLKPSPRGEYEITDVNNSYVLDGKVSFHIVKGFWGDAGTHDSRNSCEEFIKNGLEKKVFSFLKNKRQQ